MHSHVVQYSLLCWYSTFTLTPSHISYSGGLKIRNNIMQSITPSALSTITTFPSSKIENKLFDISIYDRAVIIWRHNIYYLAYSKQQPSSHSVFQYRETGLIENFALDCNVEWNNVIFQHWHHSVRMHNSHTVGSAMSCQAD